ncbi:tripartite motif-containing protein 60-like [Talpa occidentalis]|uniref:tripartite motif-containing protein 60-like n=1 Tax=Talpa occidentalis TaxID=50954 RepID=UPI00188F1805|nr:tripartite motif-containing protein 60-like [Talpa occidentalis]
MALAAFLDELQAEASCPVCLDPLRDPVTLDCGHNCCGPCLRQRWQSLQDVLPCPICQHHCPSRDAHRNPQLCALTDLLRQLPSSSSQGRRQEEEALCVQHHQALALFCEEDLELLCAQCGASSPHRGHPLVPLEQAAAQHREKLKSSLEPLRKQVEDAERGLATQVSKTQELRETVEARMSELYFEFAHCKSYLDKERDATDTRVLMEMSHVYMKVTEGRNQMSDYGATLKSLLREISTQCVQTDLGLLRGVRSSHLQWSRYANLEAPAAYSYKCKMTFSLSPHYIGLQNIMDTFQVDLTLDPETAHHNLIISRDRKSAIFTYERVAPNDVAHPKAFTSREAVLSAQGFEAGRHFWQVDIRGAGVWSLGVCKESFPRDALAPPSPCNGCWQFQRPTGTRLHSPVAAKLRVGVFLDYELGEISFYSLSTRSHLCTLTGTFTDRLIPYFSLGPCSSSFSMTLVTDES